MRNILKFSGIVLTLLGVISLIVRQSKGETSNYLLVVGLGCMILGLLFYIVVNKIVED